MIKLLHTADIHLGAGFPGLGAKGAIQREQLRETFRNIISLAIKDEVDLVIISGDLFDSNQQPQRNIDLVIEESRRLERQNIPICLIPGNHDCLIPGSIYHKIDLERECPNLTLFKSPGWTYKEFSSLSLTVYGRPCLSKESSDSPLKGLQPQTSTRYHVALVHGSLFIPDKVSPNDHVFTPEEVATCAMNYLALGHWHRHYAHTSGTVPAHYPGAPELIAQDQDEPGSVLYVELAPEMVRVTPVPVGRRWADKLEINLAEVTDQRQLKAKILQGANPDLIRRVSLKGLRSTDFTLDVEDLTAELAPNFFSLLIEDNSLAQGDKFNDEADSHSISGRFVQLLREHIRTAGDEEREIAEEALRLGLALLKGKDVL